MHILSNKSISLIGGGGGGGHSKFTLIELLVVMLVLGILMAIAIPLIGGVREAANNTKCRSNLKQLHTAIFAFATGNKERFPSALEDLVVKGYINEKTKLGNCPGSGNKQPGLVPSDYELGADLFDAGNPKTLSSTGINSNTVILEDAETTYHKAGRNAIRLDGSFTQGGSAGGDSVVVDPIITPPPDDDEDEFPSEADLLADADSPADNPAISNLYASCSHGNLHAMKRVLEADGADEIDERRGLDEWNTVGYTNLHFAWYRANNIGGIGIVKLTQFMMIKGADVNAALKINGRDFANSAAFIQGLLDGTAGGGSPNEDSADKLREILAFLE